MIIGADSAALHLVLHGCTKVAAEVWWGIKHRRALVAANCLLKTMLGKPWRREIEPSPTRSVNFVLRPSKSYS